jgi:phosphatidate cytidylyltransferase
VIESEAALVTVAGQEGRNLLLRIAAALVMAPLAVAAAYVGGWLWTSLVTVAAIGLYVEWLAVIGARKSRLVLLGILILFGVGWAEASYVPATYVAVFIALGIVAAAVFADRRVWVVIGFGYAVAASVASILVRRDPFWGFAALMFVLLVVWVTDIGGYFAGRLLGGPKLWQRISPKKTWAGAIGGFMASLGVAAGFAAFDFGRTVAMPLKPVPLLLLAAIFSIASQLGDLFESAIKRRFGVKDSSQIIPGHGGLMDRLDGFVAAIVLAALFGFLRGGADGIGRGLMVW